LSLSFLFISQYYKPSILEENGPTCNLNKLVFNGSAKLFEFPKRTLPSLTRIWTRRDTSCELQTWQNLQKTPKNPKKPACRRE